MKILVVEDTEDALSSIVSLLRLCLSESETRTTLSGPTGAVTAREFQPDVILLDVSVPGAAWLEASRLLEADPSTRSIPIVRLAAGRAEDALRAERDSLWKIVEERTRALRESEDRFRVLFKNAPIGYQSLDAEGRFLAVNDAWLDVLGYSSEEVLGQWFGDFLEPAYRDHFRANFPVFKERGEIRGVEFRMRRKDGSSILVSFDGKIGKGDDGRFLRTHCVLRDITERRAADERMKQQLDELRSWHEATLGRESRILELKREVNDLLGEAGRAPRYESAMPVAAGDVDDA